MKTSAVFPLSTAYLPGDVVTLRIFESRYLEMLSDVMAQDRRFVSVLISKGSEVGGGDSRFDHGVEIEIDRVVPEPECLLLVGHADAAVVVRAWQEDRPYPRAVVVPQAEGVLEDAERFDVASSLTLLAQRARSVTEALSVATGAMEGQPTTDRGVATVASGRWWDNRVEDSELWRAFWVVAGSVPCGALDRCHLLESGPLTARVARLHRIIDHVAEVVAFRFGHDGS